MLMSEATWTKDVLPFPLPELLRRYWKKVCSCCSNTATISCLLLTPHFQTNCMENDCYIMLFLQSNATDAMFWRALVILNNYLHSSIKHHSINVAENKVFSRYCLSTTTNANQKNWCRFIGRFVWVISPLSVLLFPTVVWQTVFCAW